MFCRNCGSKLPDDAKFCVTCGAKVEAASAPNKTNSYVDNASFARRPEPQKVAQPEKKVSFDWSEVVEESHKRKVPNVQSPWGSTGLDEESAMKTQKVVTERQHVRYSDDDLMQELNQPSKDPGRTMSFIDILKAEREEKERDAARAAMEHTERQYAAPDYSAFDRADGFSFENDILPANDREITQGYTDMNLDIVEEMQKARSPREAYAPAQPEARPREAYAPAQPAYSEPAQPAYSEPAQPAPKRYATPIEPVEPSRAPEDDYLNDYLYDAPKYDEPTYQEPAYNEPAYQKPAYQEPAYTAPAYNEPSYQKPAYNEPAYGGPSFEDAFATEPSEEDFYLSQEDDYLAPAGNSLEDELASILGTNVQPAAAPAEPVAPVAEPTPAAPVAEPTPAAPAPVASEPEEPQESEIEALKRRLAELMGESQEEPQAVVKHEAPDLEELFEDDSEKAAAPDLAYLDSDFGFDEPEPAAELTLDDLFADDEPVVTPSAAPASDSSFDSGSDVADVASVPSADANVDAGIGAIDSISETSAEPESDAMSIDDLERDLFGDDFAEDAEAEATKKIDKFYTLYKKNEEFQKLLDEEYNKLQGEAPSAEMDEMSELDALFADQKPVAQMSQPAASENLAFNSQPAQMPQEGQFGQAAQAPQMAQVAQPVQMPQAAAQPVADNLSAFGGEPERELSKKDLKAMKKAAKKKAVVEEDDDDEGGNALTIIAVVISVLLLLLLGIILILNFAPESGIGLKIDTIIQNITSYFSVLDGMNDQFLL